MTKKGVEGASGTWLRGVCPVLAVPFMPDQSVDWDSFDRLVDHQLGCGVTSMMLFGFASEFYKLSDEERMSLTRRYVARVAPNAGTAAIVSVTDHSTSLAVRFAIDAVEAGADAINILPPHYLAPGPNWVDDHIRALLSAVDVPVMVQLAPALTGASMSAETLIAIAADHANLAAIKVETIPPGRSIATFTEAGIPCLVGYAGQQLPDAVERGAVGVQPGCSIVELYQRIWDIGEQGDLGGQRAEHERLLPHISYWMQQMELIIQVEKTVLQRRGIIAHDVCRAPGWTLDTAEHARIDRLFADYPEIGPA